MRSEPARPRPAMHEQDRGPRIADERAPHRPDALPPPTGRDSDDDHAGGADGRDEPLLRGLSKERFTGHPDDPLYRERRVGQQTAGVAVAPMWGALRADKLEGGTRCGGEPSSELEGCPVMLAAAE